MSKVDLRASSEPEKPDEILSMLREQFKPKLTVTVQEASAVLGRSDDFLYERLNSDKIKGTRNGRNWTISLQELGRLIKEGTK